VLLAGDRTDLVVDDNAQEVEGVGVPPRRELLGKLREHDVSRVREHGRRERYVSGLARRAQLCAEADKVVTF
jgi:hypothetical protein